MSDRSSDPLVWSLTIIGWIKDREEADYPKDHMIGALAQGQQTTSDYVPYVCLLVVSVSIDRITKRKRQRAVDRDRDN